MKSDIRRRISRNLNRKQTAFLNACRIQPAPLKELLDRTHVSHGQLMKWMRGRSFRLLLAELLQEFIHLGLLDRVICAGIGRQVQVRIANDGNADAQDPARLSAARSLSARALEKHLLDALREDVNRREDEIVLPHEPEHAKHLVGKLRTALAGASTPVSANDQ